MQNRYVTNALRDEDAPEPFSPFVLNDVDLDVANYISDLLLQ